MSKINLNKNTKYLHFEDNEVSELDAAEIGRAHV